jgi:hypothetical protein
VTDPLDDVLDFKDFDDVTPWLDQRLALLRRAMPAELLHSRLISVTAPVSAPSPLGPYSSPQWRKFSLAAFVSDWACYEQPADRADFPRLLSVIAAFPAGFRVWMCRLGPAFVPVGYAGWYPISRTVFDLLETKPQTITHRGVMVPLRTVDAAQNYIYLFNYSIIPQLRRTAHSKTLLATLAQDLSSVPVAGAAAVTVSPDGARVAERFGLTRTGAMLFENEPEDVYAGHAITLHPRRTATPT